MVLQVTSKAFVLSRVHCSCRRVHGLRVVWGHDGKYFITSLVSNRLMVKSIVNTSILHNGSTRKFFPSRVFSSLPYSLCYLFSALYYFRYGCMHDSSNYIFKYSWIINQLGIKIDSLITTGSKFDNKCHLC